jgi:hypothetical protein
MGSMSAKQESFAAEEAPKVRALLEAAGYQVRKCQPLDAGLQLGLIVFLKLEDVSDDQRQAETEAAS